MTSPITIVAAPREGFTSLPTSLRSLFGTVTQETRVIVVEGWAPDSVREEPSSLQTTRPFEWLDLPCIVILKEARNIGGRMAETEFIVFADIDCKSHWLGRLDANADLLGSETVAPLIFIGPSERNGIYRAGGRLELLKKAGEDVLVECHRVMNRPFAEVEAPVANAFHCAFMPRGFFEHLGRGDERHITREQMDVALRIEGLGAKIAFEKDNRDPSLAFEAFEPIDLPSQLFHWADERSGESIEGFESTWSIPLNHRAIRYNWNEQHLDRAWPSAEPKAKHIGCHAWHLVRSAKAEAEMNGRAEAARPKSTLFVPHAPKRNAQEHFHLS